MKARVGVFTQEGFLTALCLILDNGLVLRSWTEKHSSLVFAGKKKTRETIDQFESLVKQLQADGWEVTGLSELDPYKR